MELKEFSTVMQFSQLSSCLDEVVKWEQNFILLLQRPSFSLYNINIGIPQQQSRDTYVKISLLTDIRNQGIFSMMVRTIIEREVKHDLYGKQ